MPIVRQPWILAIWPTSEPTAPAAAVTTTVSPGLGLPISIRPTSAVGPATISTPKASASDRPGIGGSFWNTLPSSTA